MCQPRPFGAGLLFLMAALLAVPCAPGQTVGGGNPNPSGGATGGTTGGDGGNAGGTSDSTSSASIGYQSIAAGTTPSGTYSFITGMTGGTVVFIPFSFNSLGNYSPTSVNLLLGSSTGTASLSDLSLGVYSSLPANLTLPTALMTFSATGTIATGPAVYTFTADSSPTLAANTTYYLGVTYTGSDSVNWDKTTSDVFNYAYPGDLPVTSSYGDGTAFVYHTITSSGVTDSYDNMGGFSITATMISAIPEPAAVGAITALGVLALALLVRWRRLRSASLSGAAAPKR